MGMKKGTASDEPAGTRITGVEEGGIAQQLGIVEGDMLVSINDEAIADIFDYRFQMAESEVRVRIRKADGSEWEFEVEKDESEDLGLSFEQPLMDAEQRCTNDCVFCFIDQLPPGMRETLYFKDDDSRLSFLYGNYVTMTNMKEAELDRIIRYRMSPINVSVHATNPELRVKMLGNRFAGNILERVKKLCDAGIRVNAQIVLCRGMNDGEELERTLGDLCALGTLMNSISVVPVGLTKHRANLPELTPYDEASSKEVLRAVERWQGDRLAAVGSRTAYAADEFYIMAGEPIPDVEAYEDFPQIENGVGMLASFLSECRDALDQADGRKPGRSAPRQVGIATGVSAAPFLAEVCRAFAESTGRAPAQVMGVENRFFGGHVTVTGLLTGRDVVDHLLAADPETGRRRVEGLDRLLLCRSMFKADTELLLDDMTRADIEQAIGVPVRIVANDGYAFFEAVTGIRNR